MKGLDCSGFMQVLFFMQGWIIPRDASQQAQEGTLIGHKEEWEGWEARMRFGDLLFFGEKGKNNRSDRITHVGWWMGNGEFIHASGRVRLSSTDMDSKHYDSYNLSRFLFAKRYDRADTSAIKRHFSAYYQP